MNVLFCGDEHIADGVIICTLSLLKHCKEPLHIYVLTASFCSGAVTVHRLSPGFGDYLNELVQSSNPENHAKILDLSSCFRTMPPTANLQTRFTPCCMLRLYADLVPELPERILYLDNDVICRQSPLNFYHQNMDRHEIAGVLDYYGSHFFRKRLFHKDYLNSGVLLLNLKNIRSSRLFEKCRRMCQAKEMFMPDQSSINRLCTSKLICPRKYNEQRRLHKDTVFQHFTTSFRFFPYFHTVHVKPWNVKEVHQTLGLHEYDDILVSYQKLIQTYHERSLSAHESV